MDIVSICVSIMKAIKYTFALWRWEVSCASLINLLGKTVIEITSPFLIFQHLKISCMTYLAMIDILHTLKWTVRLVNLIGTRHPIVLVRLRLCKYITHLPSLLLFIALALHMEYSFLFIVEVYTRLLIALCVSVCTSLSSQVSVLAPDLLSCL